MRLRKQDLQELELDRLANLTDQDLEKWVQNQQLQNYSTWLLPQLVSVFGQWQLKSCGKTTLLYNCKNDFQRGCWRLTRLRRSLLVKNQTLEPQYAQFTPLILLGFKRMQGFSYNQFRDMSGLEWLLEPELYKALVVDEIPNISNSRLLSIRQQGLEYKSGKLQGKLRDPTTTWQLYGIQDTELGNYPKLTQTILTQCWLAHPKLRTNTMILDLNNWDNLPETIVEEVFVQKIEQTTKPNLPWLD